MTHLPESCQMCPHRRDHTGDDPFEIVAIWCARLPHFAIGLSDVAAINLDPRVFFSLLPALAPMKRLAHERHSGCPLADEFEVPFIHRRN